MVAVPNTVQWLQGTGTNVRPTGPGLNCKLVCYLQCTLPYSTFLVFNRYIPVNTSSTSWLLTWYVSGTNLVLIGYILDTNWVSTRYLLGMYVACKGTYLVLIGYILWTYSVYLVVARTILGTYGVHTFYLTCLHLWCVQGTYLVHIRYTLGNYQAPIWYWLITYLVHWYLSGMYLKISGCLPGKNALGLYQVCTLYPIIMGCNVYCYRMKINRF